MKNLISFVVAAFLLSMQVFAADTSALTVSKEVSAVENSAGKHSETSGDIKGTKKSVLKSCAQVCKDARYQCTKNDGHAHKCDPAYDVCNKSCG